MTQAPDSPSWQHDDAPILSAGDVQMNVAAHTVSADGHPVSLSPQEFRLLRALLEHLDRVMTTQELLACAWGPNHPGDPSTLTVHILRLRTKLERRGGAARHIRTIRGMGYIFDSSSPLPPHP